jgi:DnaK suppressor protein
MARTVTDTEKSARYDVLKQMLEERRREIQDKLRQVRETVPAVADEVQDAEERSVADFVREMEFAIVEMQSETLQKIDEAIQHLEAGTYGTCAECGTEIVAARLKALPFATLCVSCQERDEARTAAERAATTRTSTLL